MAAAVKVADQQPGAGQQCKGQVVQRRQQAFVAFGNVTVCLGRSQAWIAAGVEKFHQRFFADTLFLFLFGAGRAKIDRITVEGQ